MISFNVPPATGKEEKYIAQAIATHKICIDDNIFYRGDGEQFGRYNDFAGYSIPPKTCGAMVTKDNAIDVAKKMNKDYIIFIKKDIYDIKVVN